MNADNTGANYSGSATKTGAAEANWVTTGIDLDLGSSGTKLVAEIDIARRKGTTSDTYVIGKIYTWSTVGAGDIIWGACEYTPNDNITSIVIADTAGGGANWTSVKYSIFKFIVS